MRARDYRSFAMVVGIERFGATGGNPSGRRPNFFVRQHLTFDKGGKDMVRGEGGCGFERVVGMADVWEWWAGGDGGKLGWWEVGMVGRWDGDGFTEKREVLLR